MLIQHNQPALFAQNRLQFISGQRAKASEKLSTGYRINRAADDAASLQISEKLRWQIRGLNRASRNISDGISFVQIADGALQEVHAILQRMNELCTQGANDTNTDADRDAIQAEIDQLQDATQSIFTDTKFNTLYVFTLDSTNAPPGYSIQKGLLKVIERANITQETNLSSTVTFDNATDWVSSGNLLPEFTTVATNYDPATGSVIGASAVTTVNSNTIPALTHNGTTYNLQDNWTTLLNAAPLGGTVTSNGITYTKTGTNMLIYQNGNNRLELNFSVNYDAKSQKNYYNLATATATTTNTSGKKISDSVLSFYGFPGSGGSFIQGVTYPTSYIDFSGLGTNYQISDLIDLGFASTCSHGCGCYYSIKFVDDSTGFSGTTANGLKYQETSIGGSYLIELDISNVTKGSDIVAAMVDAATKSRGFDGHWEQFAYSKNNPEKMYLYENTPVIASGSQSTWEPMPRDAAGRLTVKEDILNIQSSALSQTAIIIQKPAMSNALLGIDNLSVYDYTTSGISMQAIQKAIDYVSSKRSYLGAMQNRLEYARAIDDNSSENSQNAESRIRDTDMAQEMLSYSTLNILQQAGQSVLAQANQRPQNILSLFS